MGVIHDKTRTSHPLPPICTLPSTKFATFQTFLAFLVDSTLKITTRNFAMFGVLAFFALFGRSLEGVEGSVGKERSFEADCTIIDTVRKLSSRLWLTSESLNDEQLEVALAKERKRLLNASSHFSLPENETSTNHEEEFLYEQEETNIAKETTESANISEVAINSNFVLTEEEKVEE